MARGWDSKSVESQIADAEAQVDRDRALTREQRKIQAKRASLDLSRRRVLRELQTARSAVHRAALENALAFLDGELRKLEPPEGSR
jgi:molecular chaperone GrpE (heat shock protein)